MQALVRLWWHFQARTALFWGQPARALQRYLHGLERFPDDRHALMCAVALLAKQGETHAALVWLERAQAQWPADADVWFNTGFLLEQQGRDVDARAAFEHAVALSPSHDRAWYGLALVALRLGDNGCASHALRENTRLQPMSPYGWYQLALLEARLGNVDEARRLLKHLSNFEPKAAAQLDRELQALALVRHDVHAQRQEDRPVAEDVHRAAEPLVAPVA